MGRVFRAGLVRGWHAVLPSLPEFPWWCRWRTCLALHDGGFALLRSWEERRLERGSAQGGCLLSHSLTHSFTHPPTYLTQSSPLHSTTHSTPLNPTQPTHSLIYPPYTSPTHSLHSTQLASTPLDSALTQPPTHPAHSFHSIPFHSTPVNSLTHSLAHFQRLYSEALGS